MLRFIGGWANRSDGLRSCAQRLQRSLEYMPPQPERYGPWGVWRPRAGSNVNDLVPLDIENIDAIEGAIAAVTERINQGPMRTPGHFIELAREVVGERSDTSPQYVEYTVRAGFVDTPQPFNHLLLQLEEGTGEDLLSRYLSALVIAWEPGHLGVAVRATQRAQGHRPPQAVVGYLTYIRADVPFDRGVLDDRIDISEADGGLYIRVPGTPTEPSLGHIHQVRRALDYPAP